jgi:hypothetical protein
MRKEVNTIYYASICVEKLRTIKKQIVKILCVQVNIRLQSGNANHSTDVGHYIYALTKM